MTNEERARRADQTKAAREARIVAAMERRADYLRARGYAVFPPGHGICDPAHPDHGVCGWVCAHTLGPEALASLGVR